MRCTCLQREETRKRIELSNSLPEDSANTSNMASEPCVFIPASEQQEKWNTGRGGSLANPPSLEPPPPPKKNCVGLRTCLIKSCQNEAR